MEEILDQVRKFETILIFRHKNPDPDAIGSQVGLREILRENFPKKKILALGYDEPTLDYLAKMDEEVPVENYLAIICDTANQPRIDGNLWKFASYLIKIDHHPNNDQYGDLAWVEADRSSTSEMVADWAFGEGLLVSKEAARLLYAGIVGDTGRFLFSSTTSHTLNLASRLAELDFDRTRLSREMESIDMKVAKLQGYVYENIEIDESGAARVMLSQEVLRGHGVKDSETSSLVGLPGRIRQIKSWGIFVEQVDGHYRVRLRSKEVAIEEIAKRHNGGGHLLASGANAYSLKEVDEIWQELKNNLKKN